MATNPRPKRNPQRTTAKREPARLFPRDAYPKVMRSDPDQTTGGLSASEVASEPEPEVAQMTDSFPPPEHKPDKAPADKKSGRALKRSPDAQVKDAVTALYATAGTMIAMVNPYDGTIILLRSESMAASLIAACRPYPTAWRALQAIARGNVWTVLAMAHLAPAIAIAANHGLVSREVPEKFGLPTPPPPAERPAAMPEAQYAQDQGWAEEQYIAEMAAQMNGAATNGANGHGPTGDAGESAARAAFTDAQIAAIREQAIQQAIAEAQRAAASPDSIPPDTHNPLGWRQP